MLSWCASDALEESSAQLKWFIYPGALAVTGLLLLIPRELGFGSSPLIDLAGAALASLGGLGVPVAVGVAILRYRLYDIDLLITRTVVYGLLTALVTVVYLAIVVGVGTLVGSRGVRICSCQSSRPL